MNKLFIKNKQKGFSLFEAILAVFLVSVGIVAAVSLLSKSLSRTIDSRDQFTAGLLAQEGVELIRNFRDNTWVDSNTPYTGSFYYFPAANRTKCITDKNNTGVIEGPNRCGAPDTRLYIKDGYYVDSKSDTTNPTKFYRKIKFTYDTGSNATAKSVVITSLVSWNGADPTTDETKCNTSSKCAYTQITLNNWGE